MKCIYCRLLCQYRLIYKSMAVISSHCWSLELDHTFIVFLLERQLVYNYV